MRLKTIYELINSEAVAKRGTDNTKKNFFLNICEGACFSEKHRVTGHNFTKIIFLGVILEVF